MGRYTCQASDIASIYPSSGPNFWITGTIPPTLNPVTSKVSVPLSDPSFLSFVDFQLGVRWIVHELVTPRCSEACESVVLASVAGWFNVLESVQFNIRTSSNWYSTSQSACTSFSCPYHSYRSCHIAACSLPRLRSSSELGNSRLTTRVRGPSSLVRSSRMSFVGDSPVAGCFLGYRLPKIISSLSIDHWVGNSSTDKLYPSWPK